MARGGVSPAPVHRATFRPEPAPYDLSLDAAAGAGVLAAGVLLDEDEDEEEEDDDDDEEEDDELPSFFVEL